MRIAEGPPSTDVTGPHRLHHFSSGPRSESSGSPGSSRPDDENSSLVLMAIIFSTAGILGRIHASILGMIKHVAECGDAVLA
jgi:hypothetical protein